MSCQRLHGSLPRPKVRDKFFDATLPSPFAPKTFHRETFHRESSESAVSHLFSVFKAKGELFDYRVGEDLDRKSVV